MKLYKKPKAKVSLGFCCLTCCGVRVAVCPVDAIIEACDLRPEKNRIKSDRPADRRR